MWIQNVSMKDIIQGLHDLDDNTILIQIQDIGTWSFAQPKFKDKFIKVYQFKFDDLDETGLTNNGDGIMVDMRDNRITDEQAKDIADILLTAKQNGSNIVVHCHAGICRSGAVTECGVIYGFEDSKSHRIPNTLVKKKILKHLGLTNSWDD